MTIATTSPHRLLTLAALVTLTVACNNPTPAGAPAAGNPVTAPAASEAKPPLTGLSLVEVKVTRNPAGKLVVQGRATRRTRTSATPKPNCGCSTRTESRSAQSHPPSTI
jgi:hypothetical protein